MTAGRVDATIKAAVVTNTVFDAVLDATAILNWRNDVADKVNSNYDLLVAITQQAIINGNFPVNQRRVSGTVTLAAGAYGHDRWKAGASGCTYTFATSGNITTITITAGSLVQVIEGLNLFTGTYTLSWTGTAQGKIGAGSYGASGITGSVPGGTNLNIEFNAGTLSKVQFNVGSIALPFQPRSFAEELQLCQRYYEKSYTYGDAQGLATVKDAEYVLAATAYLPAKQDVRYKVKKRTSTPTITLYSTQNGTAGSASEFNGAGVFVADRASSASFPSENSFVVGATSGTYTVNNFIRFHWSCDAEL